MRRANILLFASEGLVQPHPSRHCQTALNKLTKNHQAVRCGVLPPRGSLLRYDGVASFEGTTSISQKINILGAPRVKTSEKNKSIVSIEHSLPASSVVAFALFVAGCKAADAGYSVTSGQRERGIKQYGQGSRSCAKSTARITTEGSAV